VAKNNAPNYTLLSSNQTVTQSFEEANDAHRVTPLIGGLPISGTNPFTVTSLPFAYDYFSMALSVADTRETYTFKTGGAGGTITGTVEINYTTSDRDVLTNGTITAV